MCTRARHARNLAEARRAIEVRRLEDLQAEKEEQLGQHARKIQKLERELEKASKG